MFVGVDVGYNKTAACFPGNPGGAGHGLRMFASVTGSAERRMFDGIGINDDGGFLIERAGRRVAIGQRAVVGSRSIAVREDAAWYRSDVYMDLFAAALSTATARVFQRVRAVVGLPVAVFQGGGAVDDVRRRLEGRHKIRRADRSAHQVFDVKISRVLPQPFGGALAQVLNSAGRIVDAELASSRFGVLDIGGATTQAMTIDHMRDTPDKSSIASGGWGVVGAVRDWLAVEAPGLDLRDHEIVEGIARGWVPYFDGRVDLGPALRGILADFGDQVMGLASRVFKDGARLSRILVFGGGAKLIGDRLQAEFRHAVLVEDPQLANAIGFYRFAVHVG
jgi:plasmid segregation protein ParM